MSERSRVELPFERPWAHPEPGRVIGRGHVPGDFLEAHEWRILEQGEGHLRVRAHLPERVKNPRGQLFGGFTPTYVDLIALFTVRTGRPLEAWLATTNMRVDYFEPVVGPEFILDGRLVKQRGRTLFVETRFLVDDDVLAVFALTTLRAIPFDRPLGDG